ncbi:sugar kinase [Cryobacterium sp. GrIS_2_6]|uniref:sugar kinase n=1 Tax=Cryobacterium sp. GrIS_2_6 TaxID=3162785 RepID=UPI002DF9FE90|nr:2-dehydro-3-deoxygluconokinase [Cryobacterium psychrotolerans]
MTDEQAGAQALQEEPGNPVASGTEQGEPQVVCFGETMGMFTPTSTTSLDIAEGFHLGVGGAESNVAAHLAELGHHVAWAGNVGQDPIGTKIISTLDCGGVDTRWVNRTEASPTGLYLKEPDTGTGAHVFYYRAGSAASELGVADAAGWPLKSAHLIHTSGITPSLSPSCSALVEHVLDHAAEWGTSVSFDVNYRSKLWPVSVAGPRLRELAGKATVVLVGLDEAATIWGCVTSGDVRALLPDVPYLVVKDGAVDATEYALLPDGTRRTTVVPAHKVEVVEPVGAGDAFAAGYLSALMNGESSEVRLTHGHSLAAWALGSREDFRPGHGLFSATPAAGTGSGAGSPAAVGNAPDTPDSHSDLTDLRRLTV